MDKKVTAAKAKPKKARKKNVPHNTTHKKAMLKALESTLGIVTQAALKAGIDRATHYTWVREDEEYAKAVKELENITLDFAESALHTQIKEGIPSSTMFFLKTKGKVRGYIETQNIEVTDKTNLLNISNSLKRRK